MSKKCICEICTCGRHRCPHRPNVPIGRGDQRCLLTEYRNTYKPHQLEVQKSCKPPQVPIHGDEPLADKTTMRVDYIPHPVGRPNFHQPDPYKTPAGEHDHLTSYVRDYPGKHAVPAMAIKHDAQHQVPSKFEGEPTYTADYKKWNLDRPKKHEQPAWIPPQDEFKGVSTFTSDYTRYHQAPRESMKPKPNAKTSDTPFDNTTGYRDAYIKHPLQAKFYKNKEVYQPSGIPIDGMSTFKRDYQGALGNKADSCKPPTQAFASNAPLEDMTTFRNDYRKWPTERPFMHEANKYKKPDGEMDMKTTHSIAFQKHPMQPHMAIRPATAHQRPGAFEGVTNYTMDYLPWDLSGRIKPKEKDEYSPNTVPFEGISTQKSHYIPHPRQDRHSFKPDSNPYKSTAAFEGDTMYRMDYTPKYVGPCPAAILNTGISSYRFLEVNTLGHKVYKPVYETITSLNRPASVKMQTLVA